MKVRYEKLEEEPLVRISDRIAIENTIKGNIWFHPLTKYKDYEETRNDTVIGDKFEAMWPLSEAYIVDEEFKNVVYVKDGHINTTHRKDFVLCLFKMRVLNGIFEFSEIQKEKLPKFGDTALFIKKPSEFYKRINNKMRVMELYYKNRDVRYYSSNNYY